MFWFEFGEQKSCCEVHEVVSNNNNLSEEFKTTETRAMKIGVNALSTHSIAVPKQLRDERCLVQIAL